jgi:hypothetical protein
LALAVPSTAGGIGPFEFFAREALVAHGTTIAASAAYAITLHMFTLVPLTLLGLVLLWRHGFSLRHLATEVPSGGKPDAVKGYK